MKRDDEPTFAAGGFDPAEAVDRLLQLRDRRRTQTKPYW
jgi:hypothetical protein